MTHAGVEETACAPPSYLFGLVPPMVLPSAPGWLSYTTYPPSDSPPVLSPARSRDEKLLIHFFQDSLAGAAVVWYTNLEASRIRTWKDLITAFLRQYQYNSDMAPDRTQLQNMFKKRRGNL